MHRGVLVKRELNDHREVGEMWPLVCNKNVAPDYTTTESISNRWVSSNLQFIAQGYL